MTPLPWLDEEDLTFPDIDQALDDPDGLLAVGGDLSVARLLEAYRHGIFPWYDDDQPILWWSPDPRCVIDPATFKPSRSLGKRLRQKDYEVTVDHDFDSVVLNCQQRGDGASTWITDDMKAAYTALHLAGHAHSVECYRDGTLIGGLYGVAIGPLFFGESMFHLETDASKVAFAHLMSMLSEAGCPLVDCQLTNPHLISLGAVEIPRSTFRRLLEEHIDREPIDWRHLSNNDHLG